MDQSARNLIYDRITSQRSAEMALRHSLSAARSSSLNCVRFIPRLPGVNRHVLPGSPSNFRKNLTNSALYSGADEYSRNRYLIVKREYAHCSMNICYIRLQTIWRVSRKFYDKCYRVAEKDFVHLRYI